MNHVGSTLAEAIYYFVKEKQKGTAGAHGELEKLIRHFGRERCLRLFKDEVKRRTASDGKKHSSREEKEKK